MFPLTHISIGLCDSEYANSIQVTTQVHLYSYDAVQLEILTVWGHNTSTRGDTPEQILDEDSFLVLEERKKWWLL